MYNPPNLLADLPATPHREFVQALLTTPGCRVERIASFGHSSPEGFCYDQETHEWVLLVSGEARLRFEGEEPFAMRPGSYVNIPPAADTGSSGLTRSRRRSG